MWRDGRRLRPSEIVRAGDYDRCHACGEPVAVLVEGEYAGYLTVKVLNADGSEFDDRYRYACDRHKSAVPQPAPRQGTLF